MLRLRSDEQLVALFRSGNNDAFRVIYDRYRQRLFAYARQMLPGSRQDAEDALQDVFVRAYNGLRANDRELALRAWLYRVAHNRCIDELRRPAPPAPEVMELVRPPLVDPIEEAEQRESLRRLVADVRRLPEQQRSALLMRELGGMSYAEVATALGVSVAAVKSLLVRARVGLAQAREARDTSCGVIREELIFAHDRGARATGTARRHMRDCRGCREFRGQLRGTSKQFAALTPAIGPVAILAKVLGFGGGASSGAAAGGTAAGGTAAVASVGAVGTGAGHIVTLLAAAVVATGGAVEIQRTIAPVHRVHHRVAALTSTQAAPQSAPAHTAPSAQAPAPTARAAAPVRQASAPAASPGTSAAALARPVHAVASPAADPQQAGADPGSWLPPEPTPDLSLPYPPDQTGGGVATDAGGVPTDGTTAGSGGGTTTANGSSGVSGTTGAGGSTGSSGSGGSTGSSGSGGSGGSDGSGGGTSGSGGSGSGGSGSGGSGDSGGGQGSGTGGGSGATPPTATGGGSTGPSGKS